MGGGSGALCLPLFLCPLLERQARKLERVARWLKGKVLVLMGRRKSTQSGSSNSGVASSCVLGFCCLGRIMAVVSHQKIHIEEITITLHSSVRVILLLHISSKHIGHNQSKDKLLAVLHATWAARYNTWLLIKLTPKGVVFSFLFFSVTCVCSHTGCMHSHLNTHVTTW